MANTHGSLKELFDAIAEAIRSKTDFIGKIKADNFPSAIRAIKVGFTPSGTKTIETNGTYYVEDYEFAEVNVVAGGDVVNSEDIEVGSLSDLHAWSKYTIGGTVVEEQVTNLQLFHKMAYSSDVFEIDYADSYEIVNNDISLVNPTAIILGKDAASRNAIKGKYVKRGEVYYIPSNARVAYGNYTNYNTIEVDKAAKITYFGANDEFVGIVVSDDSSAYPQNGDQSGYKYVYNGTLDGTVGSCNHTAVPQATPSIAVSDGGLITATSTQKAGLVSAGTKSATKQITHSNLTAANIKSGVRIFGVTGSYEGSGVVIKRGTTTSATFDTGLSSVNALILTKEGSFSATGLLIATYDAATTGNTGANSFVGLKNYNITHGANGSKVYWSITGGKATWGGTGETGFVSNATYNWVAIGYE